MLKGKRTYMIAAAIGILSAAKAMGWIDEGAYNTLLGILGATGLATLRAAQK